jgi:hypothetical protein
MNLATAESLLTGCGYGVLAMTEAQTTCPFRGQARDHEQLFFNNVLGSMTSDLRGLLFYAYMML